GGGNEFAKLGAVADRVEISIRFEQVEATALLQGRGQQPESVPAVVNILLRSECVDASQLVESQRLVIAGQTLLGVLMGGLASSGSRRSPSARSCLAPSRSPARSRTSARRK